MLTHVNPFVAVCEEKSGQIRPQRGPLGPFQAKFGGIPRRGAPSCALWAVLEVLTHYEATFELSRDVGFPLEPVQGLWGQVNLYHRRRGVRGGTQA